MDEEKAFIAAILADPKDDVVRLVYADWLEENDQPQRAELIRIQIQLAQLAWENPDRPLLKTREEELLRIHKGDWLPQPLPRGEYHWKRGFIFRAEVHARVVEIEELAGLSAIPTVEELYLNAYINDREFQYIPELPLLTSFGFDEDVVEITEASLPQITQWTKLQTLDLSFSQFLTDDALAQLSLLPDLRTLRIRGTDVSDNGFSHLARLVNLEELDLSVTLVTGEGLTVLSELPQLRRLSLVDIPLTETAINSISRFRNLESLDIEFMNRQGIGDQLLASLPNLPKLQILNANRNDITPTGFRHLSRLSQLEELTIGGMEFGDLELTYLRGLPQLRRLQLAGGRYTSHGLSVLGELSNLRALDLGGEQVTDDTLAAVIAKLRGLRWLKLAGFGITDEGFAHLAELEYLEVLDIGSTSITHAGLIGGRKFSRLRALCARYTQLTQEQVWHNRFNWAPHLEAVIVEGFGGGPDGWPFWNWERY